MNSSPFFFAFFFTFP
ncbi:pheA operon leader peptide PheL [Pseudomonas cerasi]